MKKFHLLKIAVLFATFAACTAPVKQQYSAEAITAMSEKTNAFFQQQFEAYLERHPMSQTYLGIQKDADKWDDLSDAFATQELKLTKEALQWTKDSINTDALDTSTKLSLQLFQQSLENDIADAQYHRYEYPVNQMHGMQAEIPAFLINMHQVTTVKDAENYIARLQNMLPLFNQLSVKLKANEVAGILLPKFVFAKVLDDCFNILKGQPFDQSPQKSTLYKDIHSKIEALSIAKKEKKELLLQARKALLTGVQPAYKTLITTLQAQEKVATIEDGVWKFPNGEAFYNNALQRTTTTNLTANEIHETGLKEVDRIHEEMRGIMKKVGFTGSLHDFFYYLKTAPQFYYPATKEGRSAYMAKATQIINTMETRLDELFITKPKAALQVKAVEAFREKSAGKAFYQQPAMDGSRPGTYYANMYDMKSMPTYQMEALAYHEGIPGHHMQISIAQELEDVPMFRKMGRYTAYVEGWGLYTEYLPKEMGFYEDPYADFGRLSMELFRACRLVVDTGIHAKKWTREAGITYYSNNTPNAPLDIVKMVERHIVMPSQATAYKIGMLKILELRAKAKAAMGNQFDIRKFHDVVLTNGPLPLDVLETLVEGYMATEAK